MVRYFTYHAAPDRLITDEGRECQSGPEWRRMSQNMGNHHQSTTPYRPSSIGRVERMCKYHSRTHDEQTLKSMGTGPVDGGAWPEVIRMISNTPTRATGFTPFLVHTGRDAALRDHQRICRTV